MLNNLETWFLLESLRFTAVIAGFLIRDLNHPDIRITVKLSIVNKYYTNKNQLKENDLWNLLPYASGANNDVNPADLDRGLTLTVRLS